MIIFSSNQNKIFYKKMTEKIGTKPFFTNLKRKKNYIRLDWFMFFKTVLKRTIFENIKNIILGLCGFLYLKNVLDNSF